MTFSKPILTSLTIGLLALGAVGVAFSDDDGDDDDDERGERQRRGGWVQSRADVAPATNATYLQECSACHLAYQPGLLPAAAWEQVMTPTALAAHYGDDATLAEPQRLEIKSYLNANAADHASLVRAQAFAVTSGATGVAPRITTTPYFIRKHDEIPQRLVTGNPNVGSFSQCNVCHRGAENGIYNEHQVKIPAPTAPAAPTRASATPQ
ncbi:cytochrome C [Chromatium okenii]|uniref:diheme cytochrome c n=1 Tax=Chromatium okenii TaxID=61644 RepID=UPI001907A4CC|nr:diheme cytochrome c [Chromatium okenii]MBK1641478.1 cytochrome C [Chromatium okenii]